MHNNVTVLRCDVIVRVTRSMTDAVDIDKVPCYCEQDTRRRKGVEGRKDGQREDNVHELLYIVCGCVFCGLTSGHKPA